MLTLLLLLIFRLRAIDAVIITHSHADAIGGMQCLSTFSIPIIPVMLPLID
jgi:phosphoribosyl 1,2-cyclic phosphodiesterase